MAWLVRRYEEERKLGKTYQQIADQYGVSKQAVQQSLARKYRKTRKPANCIFLGLQNWLSENERTISWLEEKCHMSLRYKLQSGRLIVEEINAILQATQATYEDLFL